MLPAREFPDDEISQRELEEFRDLETLYLAARTRLIRRGLREGIEPGDFRLSARAIALPVARTLQSADQRAASPEPIARLFDEQLSIGFRWKRFRIFWEYVGILSSELHEIRRASLKAQAIRAIGAREFPLERAADYSETRKSLWMIRWAGILYLAGRGRSKLIIRRRIQRLIEKIELSPFS